MLPALLPVQACPIQLIADVSIAVYDGEENARSERENPGKIYRCEILRRVRTYTYNRGGKR